MLDVAVGRELIDNRMLRKRKEKLATALVLE